MLIYFTILCHRSRMNIHILVEFSRYDRNKKRYKNIKDIPSEEEGDRNRKQVIGELRIESKSKSKGERARQSQTAHEMCVLWCIFGIWFGS